EDQDDAERDDPAEGGQHRRADMANGKFAGHRVRAPEKRGDAQVEIGSAVQGGWVRWVEGCARGAPAGGSHKAKKREMSCKKRIAAVITASHSQRHHSIDERVCVTRAGMCA